jgi:predicted RNA-binding Zn ribbon-like protein
MSYPHPKDSQGRVLPDPSWPADRAAPESLEFVRRFINTANRENGADRCGTAESLDAWLASEGRPALAASPRELRRILDLRATLHRLALNNAAQTLNGRVDAWAEVGVLLAGCTAAFTSGPMGLATAPSGQPVHALLADLGLRVSAAVADETWARLKACSNCHWVIYDGSKNRSSRWCSMAACGGRNNAKEYRRRHALERATVV